MRSGMRWVYSFLAATALAFLPLASVAQILPVPTPAEQDLFCPASIGNVVPIHQVTIPGSERDLGTDNEFAIQIQGNGPATLTGTIELLSKNQPYVVPFTNLAFQPYQRDVSKNGVVTASTTSYRSAPLYVSLPATSPLDAAWVASVSQATSATGACPSQPAKYPGLGPGVARGFTATVSGRTIFPDEVLRARAPKKTLIANLVPPLDTKGCSSLYTPATVIHAVPPIYPRFVYPSSGTALIRLAIDADGALINTRTMQSSGHPEMDDAARIAAAQSTFRPAQFWCSISVPGYYLFRATFSVR